MSDACEHSLSKGQAQDALFVTTRFAAATIAGHVLLHSVCWSLLAELVTRVEAGAERANH
jgi:hypothetical protein